MTRDQIIGTRQALVTQLPVTGEILRGSLFERTVRHPSGCTICAGGGGHRLWVLTISYAGGRTRQFSLRREQVDEVRRWLGRGVPVTVRHLQPDGHNAADKLLAAAREHAALLVMGGYGHSRLREWIFGGFTQHVLRGCEVPVLMA